MKGKFDIRNIDKRIVGIVLISILTFLYISLAIYAATVIKKYNKVVLPNSYIESYAIGNDSYESLDEFITFINNMVGDTKITFVFGGKELEYHYSDIGLKLNNKKILKEIEDYENSLSHFRKLTLINGVKKKVYNYEYSYDENTIREFLNNLKPQIDTPRLDGHFVDDGYSISYVRGTNSFSLNVEESLKTIVENINNGEINANKINLSGDSEAAIDNESYASINTLVSSFTTEFNPYVYARAQNLYTALNYINGAIVEPGETFSYYKYAGPYNKSGYVFYYEFVGNGVCQIATTTYNAALLGGLEIVKRYPHAAKSVYVAGGLDATVASYGSGWNVDMQWKNTYDYPIYIKAYASGGKATVEFWSNADAKKGYTYSTESVQIGYRGYQSYLNVYKDGEFVERRFIATTWYTKDQ